MENNVNFNKSIVKYFMDFIETDFHKQKSPKRKIQITDSNNFLVGCNLKRYNKFEIAMNKFITNGFKTNTLNVKKGEYTANPNEKVLTKLTDKISEIASENLKEINKKFFIELVKILKDKNLSNSILLDNSKDVLETLIEKNIVDEYIKESTELLVQIGIQEQDLETIKESLMKSIMIVFGDKISDIIEMFKDNEIENKKIKDLVDFINTENLKDIVKKYFEEYNIADLFLDINSLNATKKILDKQEFYFSFFDITYNKNKYPIFYIPFELVLNTEGNSFTITFDSQIFINKKSIEFISQELKDTINLTGKINSISERIIYLSEINNLKNLISKVFNDITAYFKIKGEFDFDSTEKVILKNDLIAFSNNFYINVFDKSDDALVNDYEEILQILDDDAGIGSEFNDIINGFMTNEPIKINTTVENEWEEKDLGDKLVFEAPISLNSEQIQILEALKKDDCKYVVVQGPPGTGKSHTITAIVFDMILNNKNVLVLSDKKEALDVVEEKIISTLNKVRQEENFQNPILRLGKTGNTYSQILSQTSLDKIKNHYKTVKNNISEIERNIKKYANSIKSDLDYENLAYDKIKVEDIMELEVLENNISNLESKFCVEELLEKESYQEDFFEILQIIENIKKVENYNMIDNYVKLFELENNVIAGYDDLIELSKISEMFNECIKSNKYKYENLELLFCNYEELSIEKNIIIKEIINEYNEQESKLFGFLFNKNKIQSIRCKLEKTFPNHKFVDLKHDIKNLEFQQKIIDNILNENSSYGDNFLKIFQKLIIIKFNTEDVQKLVNFVNVIKDLKEKIMYYEKNFEKLNFKDLKKIDKEYENRIDKDYNELIRYLTLKNTITTDFSDIPISKYHSYKSSLENLVTFKTANILDSRVIEFNEKSRSTAKLIKEIIQKKQKFPKEEFEKLKYAFPCILAGIRDYAEYIPLESKMFDLVIIDEASQVSIAQSLPALLRAKKVLVLGDKKQFSNVKSNQAKTDINNEYLSIINESYRKTSFYNSAYQLKLDKFNIRSSILEFIEYIANYDTMLYKYFRGYKEIISYSNKYFYGNGLQVMKIRGKSIDEVIKFSYIEHDGKEELIPKSNMLEVKFIINELLKLVEQESSSSIGIITPHTNQQRLIKNEIDKLSCRSYLDDKLNLKIMTFDTCQGEERDIIFYSMVANPAADSLWGVFAKDFSEMDLEEDSKIKAQRLNVGFSRSKECIHFVLSKPIEDFKGEIGKALQHYNSIIEIAKKEKDVSEVDKKSKMEPLVLNWFYQTEFWKNNNQYVEFLPQFELGKYLKQLDNNYIHPLYCVDFLLIYKKTKELKIIIEYDGFKEHFEELLNVNVANYNDYYKEEDIYRQKVLESYGYKFLRINKFNIGNNPIETFDARINEVLETEINSSETFADKIKQVATELDNGNKKECPKCKNIRDINDFKDSNLISGQGKICISCKSVTDKTKSSKQLIENKFSCPKCGSRMIKRTGRYGTFYGCSKYPYCKYTHN